MSGLKYTTFEELTSLFNQVGQGRLHMKSSQRAGFTSKLIGPIECMPVLHSWINCSRTILKHMSIADST